MNILRYPLLRVKSIRPSPHSVLSRLPAVYQNYRKELEKDPSPVHFIPEPGKWKFNEQFQSIRRIENRALPLIFPKEADEGIWGGEAVVKGFIKYKLKRRRKPTFWFPVLKKSVVYSEILNQYMQVTVTERALRLIDENCGFDNYILQTPIQDLKSQLALSIRRKMLLALLNNDKYHDTEEKQKEVFEKYKKFMISREEAEWFGLTEREAVQKQRLLEVETKKPVPLKHELRAKFIENLKAGGQDEETEEGSKSSSTSWMSKLNPFMQNKKQS